MDDIQELQWGRRVNATECSKYGIMVFHPNCQVLQWGRRVNATE